MTALRLDDGFTLALGGGGARGWAHIGVARSLEDHGLRPRRIVGTSMGAIIGAGMAAGRSSSQMEAAARSISVYRLVRKRARFALFDPRPLLERLAHEIGEPRIEDLPVPLGITTYDLVAGRPRLITSGPLIEALEMSIAVPLFFPPRCDADGVWCDAGPWEGIPVSQARAWAPDLPVVGVLVDIPKPAFLASSLGAAFLRAASTRLGVGVLGERLTARRYLGLLTSRWADPVTDEPPDLHVAPALGMMNALQFGRVGRALDCGRRAMDEALAGIGLDRPGIFIGPTAAGGGGGPAPTA